MSVPAITTVLDRVGLGPDAVPAVVRADAYSERRLAEARDCIAELGQTDGAATFALGSLGRREASDQSDLDLAFVYDSGRVGRGEAEDLRRRHIDALRDRFDIPEKTFRRAIDIDDLVHNVGGRRDSNDRLTYRALLLTEGAWLAQPRFAARVRRAIFDVYAHGRITRGRFLTSLGNDLHRYYRTVCIDYRHKVEEQDKAWAVRSLKLRHARKLWHLANVALALWAVDIDDDDERDELLCERLHWPTLTRLVEAMAHFGAAQRCRPVFEAYDRFLAALADPESRAALGDVSYTRREGSALYMELRTNASQLDVGAQELVDILWERQREHLVRFCLL